ncbi:hypothetical protein DYBT9275_04440 [Dyadobacter sp. CECT 9275]|uniref:Uncharacterized protein n=1 Tax=Dyadobacter helix TaxID=2822344 RepID=A0A916JEF8_9BACT|nr:hypothetical protein DYBT9275_04440 [Dyadobacter sp. CECT 9275]
MCGVGISVSNSFNDCLTTQPTFTLMCFQKYCKTNIKQLYKTSNYAPNPVQKSDEPL